MTKRRLYGLVAVTTVVAIAALSWSLGYRFNLSNGATDAPDQMVPRDLTIAHIVDPRVSLEKRGGSSNHEVLVAALRALRSQAGVSGPELLIISGELTLPDSAQKDSSGFAALGTALALSPASDVFLAASVPIPADSLARLRVATNSAGVRVFDLSSCFAAAAEACDVGTRYRILAPPISVDAAHAQAEVDATESAVSRAEREGKSVILVGWRLLPIDPSDSSQTKTGQRWAAIPNRKSVVVVLTRQGVAGVAPAKKIAASPPLGQTVLRLTEATRGMSLVTLRADLQRIDTLRYDQGFRRLPATSVAAAAPTPRLWSRFYQLGESLGEPGQSAIFAIAALVAFLTVAALWKVPDTVIEQVASGAAAATPAGTPDVSAKQPVVSDGDVFKSNLGRTVVSGLTGIAAVSILKDVWGVSGSAGQAFFLIAFVALFLLLLLLSAFLRALIEASRDRLVGTRSTSDPATFKGNRWRQFWLWLSSYRTTLLVFGDTFTSVLFGHAPTQVLVWTKRFAELQGTLIATADRVREQVSDAVGDALRKKKVSDARAERDYRVNVSLLASDASQTFYISAAGGSLPKIFGPKSVAYVAIRSGTTRWWKDFYTDKRKHLWSTSRLMLPGGERPEDASLIKGLEVSGPNGGPRPVPSTVITAAGKRCDDTPVSLNEQSASTVSEMLTLLNSDPAFGGGPSPARASIDANGHIVLAQATGERAKDLNVDSLTIGGIELGPFLTVEPEKIVLYQNVPEIFPGEGSELFLAKYFEARTGLDYDAFIVIPVPLSQRGLTKGNRRAGIHISFKDVAHLDLLWPGLDIVKEGNRVPDYEMHPGILEPAARADPVLAAVLSEAVRVLAEVIQPLNDVWYQGRH